jgi:hypothetical protein
LFYVEEVVSMMVKITLAGILSLLAFCTGCTMCCHPFDSCGPVYDGCGQCGSNVRAGSVLPGGAIHSSLVAADQNEIEVTAPSVEQKSPMAGEHEGATQILSVTDRKLEESEALTGSQPDDEQSSPILAQPTQKKLRWR